MARSNGDPPQPIIIIANHQGLIATIRRLATQSLLLRQRPAPSLRTLLALRSPTQAFPTFPITRWSVVKHPYGTRATRQSLQGIAPRMYLRHQPHRMGTGILEIPLRGRWHRSASIEYKMANLAADTVTIALSRDTITSRNLSASMPFITSLTGLVCFCQRPSGHSNKPTVRCSS